MLEEYFPHFVRERLLRELIVFNFHQEGKSLRGYVEQVFLAARFLRYWANELQLVDRIVMNLHPSVRDRAAQLEGARSRKELHRVIGLIDERMVVVKERQRGEELHPVSRDANAQVRNKRHGATVRSRQVVSEPPKCWGVVSQATTDVIVPLICASGKWVLAWRSTVLRAKTYKHVTQDKCGVP